MTNDPSGVGTESTQSQKRTFQIMPILYIQVEIFQLTYEQITVILRGTHPYAIAAVEEQVVAGTKQVKVKRWSFCIL